MTEAIRQLQKLADNARELAYKYETGTDQQRAYNSGMLAAYNDAIRIIEKGLKRDEAR